MAKRNEALSLSNIALNFVMVLFTALVLIPFILLLVASFTDETVLMQQGYKFFPPKLSTAGYQFLFSNAKMVRNAYAVTIFVTVVGTFGHVLLCSLTAYPLTKSKLPGNRAITFYVFLPMILNGGLVAFYIVCTRILGFRNNYIALILPLMMSVFNVLILRTFFLTSIPAGIEESAKIDGASDVRIFFQIVIPMSKPVLATIALLAGLVYWGDWFLSLLFIQKEAMYSLQFVMLQSLRQVEAIRRLLEMGAPADVIVKLRDLPTESVRFAMVVVSVGPIILAYPFFQRYFVKGMTLGAIKG